MAFESIYLHAFSFDQLRLVIGSRVASLREKTGSSPRPYGIRGMEQGFAGPDWARRY
jgi:hypothetical protein